MTKNQNLLKRYAYRKLHGLCTTCGIKNDTKQIICSVCKEIKSNHKKKNKPVWKRNKDCNYFGTGVIKNKDETFLESSESLRKE